MDLPFLQQFQNVIDASSKLSDISKKTYKDRLRRLTTITKHDVDWIISHCKETYESIQHYQLQTQKGYINSVLALFKYTKNLKNKHPKTYTCWYKLFMKVHNKSEEKYNNMEPSERQKSVYVPWVDIVKKRETLPKTSLEYLLISLYTMIPPSRADMNMIKIYYNNDPIDNSKFPNYLVINANNMKLVYNEFKSKSRRIQKYEKILPKNLEDVIRQSLKHQPRDFLIVSPRTQKPYDHAGSFSVLFGRILEKVFNKKVTINTLRHSFVNSLDMNKLTPLEKEILSKDLMHSKETMDKYRLSVPGSKSSSGKDQICEVVCHDK